jgi:hypothetical protein
MQSANDREVSLLVIIREFVDMPEALLAQCCLDSARIESFWPTPISRGSNGVLFGA